MTSQTGVGLGVDAIQNEINQIETGEQGRGEVNVLRDRQVGVVSTADGVGRSKDAGPGIERSDDAGLGYGYSLLLHDFVQDRAGRIVHLVELVNAADTAVGQDERTRFQHKLTGFRVASDVGCETDR